MPLSLASLITAIVSLQVFFQNAAARVQHQLVQYAAARDLNLFSFLKPFNWLPVCNRTDWKIVLLTYKSLYGWGPKYVTDRLALHDIKVLSRPLRSSVTNLLIIPRVNTIHLLLFFCIVFLFGNVYEHRIYWAYILAAISMVFVVFCFYTHTNNNIKPTPPTWTCSSHT